MCISIGSCIFTSRIYYKIVSYFPSPLSCMCWEAADRRWKVWSFSDEKRRCRIRQIEKTPFSGLLFQSSSSFTNTCSSSVSSSSCPARTINFLQPFPVVRFFFLLSSICWPISSLHAPSSSSSILKAFCLFAFWEREQEKKVGLFCAVPTVYFFSSQRTTLGEKILSNTEKKNVIVFFILSNFKFTALNIFFFLSSVSATKFPLRRFL